MYEYYISPSSNLTNITVVIAEHDMTGQQTSGSQHDTDMCQGQWKPSTHVLFQLAHGALLLGFMVPSTTQGVAFMHGTLIVGFLLMSTWAWVELCAPDIFSWNFSFMLINSIQLFFVLYRLRPVKFAPELEEVYEVLFQPMKVPREVFKKLVSHEYCNIMTLADGETYATQEVTRTDRLSLLIHGMANVLCSGQLLHPVREKQFLDSPEFEATTHSDEKFRVSIIAGAPCRYIMWQRQTLEYLFNKEPYLASVMGLILGRDITNKIYSLNDKLRISKGSRLDIRLPSVSTAALSGADLRALSLRQEVPSMLGDRPFSLSDEEESDEVCLFPTAVGRKTTRV